MQGQGTSGDGKVRSGSAADERVLLGEIVAAHGVRGLVKVRTFTEAPELIVAYGPLSDQEGRPVELSLRGPAKAGVLAAVGGVHDRDAAEALRGCKLYVPRDALPAPDEDEFYLSDLIGLTAFLPDGAELGRITAVQDYGAGPLLEIVRSDTRRQVMVPFTREMVPEVDVAGGRVVIEPVPGLLD